MVDLELKLIFVLSKAGRSKIFLFKEYEAGHKLLITMANRCKKSKFSIVPFHYICRLTKK